MTGEKRKPNAYIMALKEFNKGKSMWCIPKKGTEDHKEVTRLKEKFAKGEHVEEKKENVVVHEKVKAIEKKIEKKEEKPSYVIELEKKFDEYSEFDKMGKEKWDKLTAQQKRYVMRMIQEDLPQIAQNLKKKHPFPDMKSLPKYMHKAYKEYEKESQ